eukprot:TRINITY_DN4444_c0_g1_i1.p1 TRINITY_DN4444_c0_g1~~TRINITY_DN4444_c0_g1_i1.p1  ORF type:complete len:294 (+),score=15.12 TRINITY_DN4444_c0_g1_i1:30-911(+)
MKALCVWIIFGICVGWQVCFVTSACLQSSCKLVPETTEGPFYAESMLVRQDITEGNDGVPLILNITVTDTNTCKPIVGAAVDIWHCNSLGVYSAFAVQGTQGETYLRGIQFTDNNGVASFKTIYPGWYPGRVTHIHVKVHINSTLEDSSDTIIGGHVTHTGQVYFNDTIDNQIAMLAPYSDRASILTPQNSDSIFVNQGGIDSLLDLQFIDKDTEYIGGLVASIILGVEVPTPNTNSPGVDSPTANNNPVANSPISNNNTPVVASPTDTKTSGSVTNVGCTMLFLGTITTMLV